MKRSWPVPSHYPGICLGRLRKTTTLSDGLQFPGRDVKQERYPLNSAVPFQFLPRVSFQYNEIRPGNLTSKGKDVKNFSTE
jgi:hypothetical protein